MNYRHWAVNPEGSRSNVRRREMSSSGLSSPEGSIGGSSSSSRRNKRKRHYQNNSRDEFKKARLPTFSGEVKSGQEMKLCFLE